MLTGAILLTLLGMMLHIHLVKVDHESVLVIGSLGIQVSSSYASGRETSTFIEMSQVKDVVINEAIYMVIKNIDNRCCHMCFMQHKAEVFVLSQHQIIYYLCILLKDPSAPDDVSSVVPLFQVRIDQFLTINTDHI